MRLIDAGVALDNLSGRLDLYVSHRLGHANTAVTAKYYVCDDIEADRKMANVA